MSTFLLEVPPGLPYWELESPGGGTLNVEVIGMPVGNCFEKP